MAESTQSIETEGYIDELLFVKNSGIDGCYGGWKRELLIEKITSNAEERLLLCTLCKGMLRDACVFEVKFQKKEARCDLCIPREHQTELKKKAELIRSVIDEKLVIRTLNLYLLFIFKFLFSIYRCTVLCANGLDLLLRCSLISNIVSIYLFHVLLDVWKLSILLYCFPYQQTKYKRFKDSFSNPI